MLFLHEKEPNHSPMQGGKEAHHFLVVQSLLTSGCYDERRGGTSRLGVSLETHVKIVSKAEVKAKL
jgi:hypothetical protein